MTMHFLLLGPLKNIFNTYLEDSLLGKKVQYNVSVVTDGLQMVGHKLAFCFNWVPMTMQFLLFGPLKNIFNAYLEDRLMDKRVQYCQFGQGYPSWWVKITTCLF